MEKLQQLKNGATKNPRHHNLPFFLLEELCTQTAFLQKIYFSKTTFW